MNDLALARYLKTCCRRLNQQQTALIEQFSLRTCGDIEVQQALGMMNVDLPGRGRAIATITPIARYRPIHQSWSWAWAASEPFPMQGHGAIALQSLAQKTGLDLFNSAEFQLPLEQVSLLLAMACSRLKASGYYRWVEGEEFVFLAVNHMALATAPLESSRTGDRLKLTPLNSSSQGGQTQLSQLVRPSPSLLGHATPTWPNQRSVEGLFIHTLIHSLCQGDLADLAQTLVGLKSLTGNSTA